MKLLIIEAIGKIKSVEKALSNDNAFSDFSIFATSGQIYDTPNNKLGLDLKTLEEEKFFRNPNIAEKLLSKIKSSEHVYLMTDNDDMGEQIARDVIVMSDLPRENYSRVRISSMHPEEIKTAIIKSKHENIDDNMIASSDARRILNKIIGFGLVERKTGKEQSALYGGLVTPVLQQMLKKKLPVGKIQHNISHPNYNMPLKTHIEVTRKGMNNLDKINFLLNKIEQKIKKESINKKRIDSFFTNMNAYDGINIVSKSLKKNFRESEKLLQKSYQKGNISYFRTQSKNLPDYDKNTYEDLKRKYSALEASNLTEFDKDELEDKVRLKKEPHPCIHPTSISNNLNDDIDYLKEEDSVAAIIARRFNLINNKHSVERLFIDVSLTKEEKERFLNMGALVNDTLEYYIDIYSLNGKNEKYFDENVCLYDFIDKGKYRKFNKEGIYLNKMTPEEKSLSIMYENGIGKPSTWGYLSNKIGNNFNESFTPNGLAKMGYMIAKEKIPILLDINNAVAIENIMNNNDSMKEKIIKGLIILGVDYEELAGIELQPNMENTVSGFDRKSNLEI